MRRNSLHSLDVLAWRPREPPLTTNDIHSSLRNSSPPISRFALVQIVHMCVYIEVIEVGIHRWDEHAQQSTRLLSTCFNASLSSPTLFSLTFLFPVHQRTPYFSPHFKLPYESPIPDIPIINLVLSVHIGYGGGGLPTPESLPVYEKRKSGQLKEMFLHRISNCK